MNFNFDPKRKLIMKPLNTLLLTRSKTAGALPAYPVTDVSEQSTFKVRVTNTTPRRALVALAAALAVSFGATSPAGATNLACKPTVTVTNLRPGGSAAIKIVNFQYKVDIHGDEIFTEGLVNKILTDGDRFEDWPSQTLQDAATGNKITQTAVGFRVDNGRGWGSLLTSAWFPHSFLCGDEHTYKHEIR
jgi:hypothetical protein